METKRRNFQGVLNILSFNRHFYYFGLGVIAIVMLSKCIITWNSILFWGLIISFSYGLVIPLIISAYVYDFSGYYNFRWLKKLNIIDNLAENIVNINAGFDETSFILKTKFRNTNLMVFDFYDQEKHTEIAITRARKVSLVYPNTTNISTSSIPLKDKSVDLIFLLSAAHEIRSFDEKVCFLRECKRICSNYGNVILVEHLRDLPNFLAFSVGFTHFFSKKTWIKAFREAGFHSCAEYKFTPFMSIFKFS